VREKKGVNQQIAPKGGERSIEMAHQDEHRFLRFFRFFSEIASTLGATRTPACWMRVDKADSGAARCFGPGRTGWWNQALMMAPVTM
jgi:hypothetical protein